MNLGGAQINKSQPEVPINNLHIDSKCQQAMQERLLCFLFFFKKVTVLSLFSATSNRYTAALNCCCQQLAFHFTGDEERLSELSPNLLS